ncbi:unnamed protein product [Schistosoma margrebowiei]|uniref:Uncharacterized protein n=1 Tax=Schistosoma margrebowiei TaxID=48269 RepID=A0AA84ZEA9_9TREM|nr:unnamed protein product [Schistosoma margrebowiei]
MGPIQRISGILFYIKWYNFNTINHHMGNEYYCNISSYIQGMVKIYKLVCWIVFSIILSIPVSRLLCELEMLWIPSSWVITLGITLLTIIFGKLIRFDIQTSLNIFFTVIFTLQAVVYIAMIILNYYDYFDVILIISGSGMLLTIIYELAIATQAIFPGDRRFIFRDNQYFLCGLVLATIMIWMNMIISSEILLIYNVFNKTNQYI